MSNITNYYTNNIPTELTEDKPISNVEKITQFVQYLYDFRSCIEKEVDDMEKIQKISPNKIFPIEMKALAAIHQASGILYKWYCERA